MSDQPTPRAPERRYTMAEAVLIPGTPIFGCPTCGDPWESEPSCEHFAYFAPEPSAPDDDSCTCTRYVVDYSDPERYHPENMDRELTPGCPEHDPHNPPEPAHYLISGKGYATGGNVPAPEPSAPDDLQEQIAAEIESADGHIDVKERYDAMAAAVMDVLRREGLVT